MRSDAKVYKVIAEVLGGWRLQCDDSGEYVEKPGASLAVFSELPAKELPYPMLLR